MRRVLMVVLVLGLPAAAVSAGLTAYEASMRTVRTQAAERHHVTARLTSTAEGGDWVKRPAPVRWTDLNGVVRTGTALVKPGTPKGSTVRVWVTRDGQVTEPPATTLNATTSGWLVGRSGGVRRGRRILRGRGGHAPGPEPEKVRAVGCRMGSGGTPVVRALPSVTDLTAGWTGSMEFWHACPAMSAT